MSAPESAHDLAGKVVVITGAGSGIGAACATRFAAEGAVVVGLDLKGADIVCDVSDRTQVDHAVAEILASLGGVDVLTCVAGITWVGHFEDITPDLWDRTFAVNVTGTYHLIQACLPSLRQRGGNVVTVASVAGVAALPYQAAYAASKAAVIGLTRSLAVEYAGDLVRFNTVCPGTVNTPMVAEVAKTLPPDLDPRPAMRMQGLMPGLIEPEEIAAAVVNLAGATSRSVTGAVLTIDRGIVG